MKIVVLCCIFLGCFFTPCFAAEDAGAKDAAMKGNPPLASPPPKVEKGELRAGPFSIDPRIAAQREEVEAPEIEVTGIVQAQDKNVALARLQLEKTEGKVLLEKGMRVSIPKPDRTDSESEKWTTYFTVKQITGNGMEIVLENGEVVWYPVIGPED